LAVITCHALKSVLTEKRLTLTDSLKELLVSYEYEISERPQGDLSDKACVWDIVASDQVVDAIWKSGALTAMAPEVIYIEFPADPETDNERWIEGAHHRELSMVREDRVLAQTPRHLHIRRKAKMW
jgi:hypothetical protein